MTRKHDTYLATMKHISSLEANPDRATPDTLAAAQRKVDYWTARLNPRMPTVAYAENPADAKRERTRARRRARMGLFSAIAYRDALKAVIHGTAPKRERHARKPGEAAKLATIRYRLKRQLLLEYELMGIEAGAREDRDTAVSIYDEAAADLYIQQQEDDERLAMRRVALGPKARRAKGTIERMQTFKVVRTEARFDMQACVKAHKTATARLARCRSQIDYLRAQATALEKKF